MTKILLGVALIGLVASGANAALLELRADDGSDTIWMWPGSSADISLMLEIRDIDTGFAFAEVFLNDDDDMANGVVDVTGFTTPLAGVYDDSAFTLPADISHDLNNEYGLIYGNPEGGNWGPGTYTLTTLTLALNTTPEFGWVPVTFEKGARAPGIFTADFVQLWWGFGLDNVLPNFADPGVGGEDHPFNIYVSPEPAALALVAVGGLALLRRR